MCLKLGGKTRRTAETFTISFHVPDELHEQFRAQSKSLGESLDATYLHALAKGLYGPEARDYLTLRIENLYLNRSVQYSHYAKDNRILRGLVEPLEEENAEMRQILVAKGLLRKIQEKKTA